MLRLMPFLIAAALCLSLGCVQRIETPKQSVAENTASEQLKAYIGKRVQIQFRRDVLGASRELPVGPETSSINGAGTSLYGELESVTETSLVISDEDRPRWIPLDVVLYVQVNP